MENKFRSSTGSILFSHLPLCKFSSNLKNFHVWA